MNNRELVSAAVIALLDSGSPPDLLKGIEKLALEKVCEQYGLVPASRDFQDNTALRVAQDAVNRAQSELAIAIEQLAELADRGE